MRAGSCKAAARSAGVDALGQHVVAAPGTGRWAAGMHARGQGGGTARGQGKTGRWAAGMHAHGQGQAAVPGARGVEQDVLEAPNAWGAECRRGEAADERHVALSASEAIR